MRMWQGASGVSNYQGIVSPAYTVLIPNPLINVNMFSYLFKTQATIYTFKRYSQGLTSDTWNLKYPELSHIILTIPNNKKEQTAISNFFRVIDISINEQNKRINNLNYIKTFLLQNMFI